MGRVRLRGAAAPGGLQWWLCDMMNFWSRTLSRQAPKWCAYVRVLLRATLHNSMAATQLALSTAWAVKRLMRDSFELERAHCSTG